MDIFEFNNYKSLIQKLVQSQASGGRGEWRKIALSLNISTTLVSQIFNGDRNLTPEQALDLTDYWGFNSLQTDYFMCLVHLERGGSVKYRSRMNQKLEGIRSKAHNLKDRLPQDRELSEEAKTIFYSNWIYMAVWVLSSIQQFQNFESMQNVLPLSRKKLREALDFLLENDICRQEDDKIVPSPHRLHLEADSKLISRHHTNWRLKTIEHSDQLASNELMFTAPLSLSTEDFQKVKKKLLHVISEVGDIAENSEAELPAVFNIDLVSWATLKS